MAEEYVVAFVTARTEDEAAAIAREVVRMGLAACCNIVGGVRSIYTWKDELCDEKEVLCVFKTRKELFEKLRDTVVRLHSYEVPEVVSVRIDDGHRDYLNWISEVTHDVRKA